MSYSCILCNIYWWVFVSFNFILCIWLKFWDKVFNNIIKYFLIFLYFMLYDYILKKYELKLIKNEKLYWLLKFFLFYVDCNGVKLF